MSDSVLLVENDSLAQETILHMIQLSGRRAVGVQDMSTALGVLQGMSFDVLVVSTTRSHLLSEFISAARSLAPYMTVVVISGSVSLAASTSSSNIFLQKPFSVHTLNEVLDNAASSRRLGSIPTQPIQKSYDPSK